MKMQLDPSFIKKLERRIEGFEFEVGILEDKPHYNPVEAGLFGEPELKSYAGGPARKQTRQAGPLTNAEILVENMKRLNMNILLRPFQEKSSELMKFTTYFLKMACGAGNVSIRRVENLLQAVVRNPILNQEYGRNSSQAADNKGFNRHMIDTGQLFKNIRARAKRV